MSHVVFLGAGASKAAGYPLASELLTTLKSAAEKSKWVQFEDAWSRWVAFQASAPPPIRLLLHNANPEVVLSLPDLFDLAVNSEDEHRFAEAVHTLQETGESHHEGLEAYFESDERKSLSEAQAARSHLVQALYWFFLLRHHQDKAAPRCTRSYLQPLFANLGRGDAILTTNWDPLAERILAEHQQWHPSDGYGFPRKILMQTPQGRAPLPQAYSGSSAIVVLKLHGCFGWKRIDDLFFLDGEEFLDVFGFSVQLRDEAQPAHYQPAEPLAAYPSFLKPLSDPILMTVWRRAADALQRSSKVTIAGYSLPLSDAAIRALLLPVASRLADGEVDVTVIDRSSNVLERWAQFLGPGARLRQEELAKPCPEVAP